MMPPQPGQHSPNQPPLPGHVPSPSGYNYPPQGYPPFPGPGYGGYTPGYGPPPSSYGPPAPYPHAYGPQYPPGGYPHPQSRGGISNNTMMG